MFDCDFVKIPIFTLQQKEESPLEDVHLVTNASKMVNIHAFILCITAVVIIKPLAVSSRGCFLRGIGTLC